MAVVVGWLAAGSLTPAADLHNDREMVEHVLNRLTFGPRAGEVERVRQMGLNAWIDGQLHGPWVTSEDQIGLGEIALVTAFDWMVFRDRYPVDTHPAIARFRAAHVDHPSLEATYPVVA